MDVLAQVLVLIWIVLFVVTLRWAHIANRGVSVVTWIALTLVTLWLEFLVAFVAMHAALFSLGREATMVVIILTMVIVVLTPAAWAYALGHWHKSRSVHP
jgi:hypothetical protein